jgi:putative spermidine/putrescine transport system permease protein
VIADESMPAAGAQRRDPFAIAGRALLLATVAFWFVFLAAPIEETFGVSLTATEYTMFPPPSLSLRWYRHVLGFAWFTNSIVVSTIVATAATGVSVTMGLAGAMLLARRRFRGRQLFEYLMLSPLIIPSVVIGFALLGFDRRLEDAALSLGATPVQTFCRVTLPSILPGIVAGAIIAFTFSFNDVTVSIFLVGPATRTLPVELMSQMEYLPDPTPAAASSIVMLLTIGFFVLIERTIGLNVFASK